MRLLHVVPTYIPAFRYGGPIYSVHGLCKSLVRRGHDVHVFTTSVNGPVDSEVPLGVPVDIDGVKVWYFKSSLFRRTYFSLPMWRALKSLMPTFDLVHLHSIFLWPTWAAASVARKKHIPYLLSPRGMLVKSLISRKSRWLKTLWPFFVEKKNIENASSIHVTSSIEEEELVAFGYRIRQVCQVPNGIDVSKPYQENEVSDDVKKIINKNGYVLYLGRLNWKKGLDRLIKGWVDVHDAILVIAGNDEEGYANSLYDYAEQSGAKERIIILDRRVSGADKEAMYKNASIFVLPSYSENFGNTVLEAMIRKLPVIVSNEVGAAAIVEQAQAGLVVSGDEFSDGIKMLLSDAELMSRCSRNGFEWVSKNMLWERVAQDVESCYQGVIGDGS